MKNWTRSSKSTNSSKSCAVVSLTLHYPLLMACLPETRKKSIRKILAHLIWALVSFSKECTCGSHFNISTTVPQATITIKKNLLWKRTLTKWTNLIGWWRNGTDAHDRKPVDKDGDHPSHSWRDSAVKHVFRDGRRLFLVFTARAQGSVPMLVSGDIAGSHLRRNDWW